MPVFIKYNFNETYLLHMSIIIIIAFGFYFCFYPVSSGVMPIAFDTFQKYLHSVLQTHSYRRLKNVPVYNRIVVLAM